MKRKHNKEDMTLKLGSKIVHESRRFMYDAVEKHHKKYYKKNKKSYKKIFLESRN